MHTDRSTGADPRLCRILRCVAVAFCGLGAGAALAQRIEKAPPQFDEVGLTERFDAQIPLELPFMEFDGKKAAKVTLGQFFDGSLPVILTLNYSNCPQLCSLQLNGLVEGMKRMKWKLGQQYQVITVSIDPLEGPRRAYQTKRKYLQAYGRPGCAAGWHFLTNRNEEDIKRVGDAAGFHYVFDPETRQYAHLAVAIICTPDGRVSQYLGGVEYDPQTLRLSLVEAAEGKVGSNWDQVLLYCFHFDPASGRYALSAFRLMQIGGGLTVLIFGGMLSAYWLHEARKRKKSRSEEAR